MRKTGFALSLVVLLALALGLGAGFLTLPARQGKAPAMTLRPVDSADLPGWQADDTRAALAAFKQSCKGFARRPAARKLTGTITAAGVYGSWRPVCAALGKTEIADAAQARAFLLQHFQAFEVLSGDEHSLFTGYYEPQLRGRRLADATYRYPLLARPDDLITVNAGDFKTSLKGHRLTGRVVNRRLKPYFSRGEIDAGKIRQAARALAYVDDPVDAFFLHIQGSGRIALEGGGEMRLGYAGQNGHRYFAIGRELLKRGALARGKVSLQSIKAWLRAHPKEGREVMNLNPSYVFFRELKGPGPLGAFGVPLTAGRSLAVDYRLIPQGVPVWLSTQVPDPAGPDRSLPFERLMVAQDTGGAIRGPVRGDIFFGHGAEAEIQAGHMKFPGRWFVLLPRK